MTATSPLHARAERTKKTETMGFTKSTAMRHKRVDDDDDDDVYVMREKGGRKGGFY